MMAHWKNVAPNFEIHDEHSWPQPSNGKVYSLTSRDWKVAGLPLLTTSNYRVQAVIAYLLDPSLSRVHFGQNTHAKLLLLSNPLYLLCGGVENYNRLFHSQRNDAAAWELEGSDQSWHIVSIPNKHGVGKIGQAIPWSSHIDAGENSVFGQRGIPLLYPPGTSEETFSLEEQLLFTLLHQLAIIFYCETPGDLNVARGATGFYPLSHLALLKGMQAAAREHPKGVPWAVHTSAIKAMGESPVAKCTLQQPVLREDQQLLGFGLTMHATTWAVEAMEGGFFRVIQNCKLKSSVRVRGSHELQRTLVKAIPSNSLLRLVARGDMQELGHVLGLSEEEIKSVWELADVYARAVVSQGPK